MPATTYTEAERSVQMVINQLRIMHGQGVDVSAAYEALDTLREKDDEKSRTSKMLQGVAETALMGSPATLFVLAYRKQGLVKAAYGLERQNGQVTIELGHGWPVSVSAESMADLHKRLAEAGIEYSVAYAEKPKKDEGSEEAASSIEETESSYRTRYPINYRQG